MQHGKGKYYWLNGDSFSGGWNNNKLYDLGGYAWCNNVSLYGNWADGALYNSISLFTADCDDIKK